MPYGWYLRQFCSWMEARPRSDDKKMEQPPYLLCLWVLMVGLGSNDSLLEIFFHDLPRAFLPDDDQARADASRQAPSATWCFCLLAE